MWWRIVGMMAVASFVGSFLGSLTELYMAFKSMQKVNNSIKQAMQQKKTPPPQQPQPGPQAEGEPKTSIKTSAS